MLNSSMSSESKKNKELTDRLMILEKFIELKSNECAYYRSKVHLMQINPMRISTKKSNCSVSIEQQTESEGNDRSIKSNRKISRLKTVPLSLMTKAKNQNYSATSPIVEPSSLVSVRDKTIQCNEKDFQHRRKSNPVLIVPLTRPLIESLEKRKCKVKVQFSSDLVEKLFHSINDESQIEARVELRSHLKTIRHRKTINEKNSVGDFHLSRSNRRRKRHVQRRINVSCDESNVHDDSAETRVTSSEHSS